MTFGCLHLNQKTNEIISVFLPYLSKIGQIKKRMQIIMLEDTSFFGSNEDIQKSFWNYLTFLGKISANCIWIYAIWVLDYQKLTILRFFGLFIYPCLEKSTMCTVGCLSCQGQKNVTISSLWIKLLRGSLDRCTVTSKLGKFTPRVLVT